MSIPQRTNPDKPDPLDLAVARIARGAAGAAMLWQSDHIKTSADATAFMAAVERAGRADQRVQAIKKAIAASSRG